MFRHLFQRNKNVCSHKNLYTNVTAALFIITQTSQMSLSGQIVKLAQRNHETVLSKIKVWITDTCSE